MSTFIKTVQKSLSDHKYNVYKLLFEINIPREMKIYIINEIETNFKRISEINIKLKSVIAEENDLILYESYIEKYDQIKKEIRDIKMDNDTNDCMYEIKEIILKQLNELRTSKILSNEIDNNNYLDNSYNSDDSDDFVSNKTEL